MTNNSINGNIEPSEEEKALKKQRLQEFLSGGIGGSGLPNETVFNEIGLTSFVVSLDDRTEEVGIATTVLKAKLDAEGVISYDGI